MFDASLGKLTLTIKGGQDNRQIEVCRVYGVGRAFLLPGAVRTLVPHHK